MRKAEARHLAKLADLGCICCELLGYPHSPAEIHHLREGEAAGAGQKSSHFLAIPLCPDHHRGDKGVHGDKSYLRLLKMTETDLLAETLERVYG